MKKLFISMLLLIIAGAFISCKKSNDPAVDETSLLMNRNWKVTGSVVSPAFNGVTDVYANQPTCAKDDIYRFNPNNVHVFDEGPTKCSASDPQTITGTWSYNPTSRVLFFTARDQANITISEITATTLKGTTKDTFLGVIYTYNVSLSVQ